MKRGSRDAVAAACVLLAGLAWGASAASAEIVRTSTGHFFGLTLHRGVAPASIPGSMAAQHKASFSSNGNLNYHGGPVVHSSAAYLVFWTPSGFSIPASSQTLLSRYFSDAAAGSGASSNVFAVNRQFSDGSGFAADQQTFSSTQVITNTQAYPAFDANHCGPLRFGESACISDAQIEAELQRLISTGLPDDGPATASTLPSNAPIFFVVLPSNVNVCDQQTSCADNVFCSYHSSFSTSTTHHNVLYATIPFLPATQIPKQCQNDGNSAIQEPNGDLADVVLKYLSHEQNEVLTDPTGFGWFDSNSGNENGDNCNATGSANPQGGGSPTAFLPVLGGSVSSGTLYDQLMAGDPYYVQSEWSNGDVGCQMAPSAGAISPAFSQPSGPNPIGTQVTFDPSASSSSNPYSSASWSFGDGATSFKAGSSPLAVVRHTYSAAGNYAVSLTLVDDRGNLAKTTRSITIGLPPTAAFSSSPSTPLEGTRVSFDASGSSDPDSGVGISSYAWNFGDGATQTVTTPTTGHTFTHYGTYTVTLTVTNSIGLTNSISHQVTVFDEKPVSSFVIEVPNPTTGQLIPFDGSASSDPDGQIASYVWSFGDGGTATGLNPSHAYPSPGTYSVTLTLTDSDGQTKSSMQQVTVTDGPIASFTFTPMQPLVGDTVTFDGSGSTDPPGGTITTYSWNFGDGSPTVRGSNPMVTHAYTRYGTYTVRLTVTDSNQLSDIAPQAITVHQHPPTASFTAQSPVPPAGQPVAFDGSSSSDPDGPITAYSWDFGDGTTGTGAKPSHTYQMYGTYPVVLTVTVGDGQTATISHQLTVHALPQAAFTYAPSKPGAGTPIGFDGTVSSDPEAGVTIVSYAWNFGDGTTIPAGQQSMPTHSYAATGDYVVTLTVQNSLGLSNTQTHHVVVLTGPTAAFSVQSPHPTSGQLVAFDGSASSDPNSSISSYAWTFGDGGIATGPTPSHIYSNYGQYAVTLTVTDGNGLSSTFTQQVTLHAPPTLRIAFAPPAPLVGTSVGFDAAGSNDPEPGASIASYSWDFGDGTMGSGSSASHAYQRPGTYTVTLTVASSFGTSASITKPVAVSDRLPTAVIVVGTAHPRTGQPVRFDGTHSTGILAPIASYRWSFGDSGTGSGARPAHRYRKPGSYRVALTVTDGFGGSTTAVATVRVDLAGRITGLSLRSAAQGATLVISVNSAGVVSAGHQSIRVRHRGLVRLRIQLSTAQVQRLDGNGSLTIHVALRFAPHLGPPSRERLTIVFRAPPAPSRRVYARLQR